MSPANHATRGNIHAHFACSCQTGLITTFECRYWQRLNLRCVDISKRHVERLHRQVLKPDEVERLLEFCGAIGLDYGELDVLLDNGDGRIYVVDVNKPPTDRRITYQTRTPRSRCSTWPTCSRRRFFRRFARGLGEEVVDVSLHGPARCAKRREYPGV